MSNQSPYLFNYQDYFNLRKNGIAPVNGISLYFISAASGPYILNAININDATAAAGQSLVLWPINGGTGMWNSTWQLTPDGFIICPYAPEFVIGISNGSTLCILSKDSNDPTQKWSLNWFKDSSSGNEGYTIYSSEAGMYITASSQGSNVGWSQYGNLSLTAISDMPSLEQLWLALPTHDVPSNSFYIQSAMGSSGWPGEAKNPYVVTAQTSNNIFSAPWVPGNADQLWRFNPDGTISLTSDLYEGMVLTSTSTSNQDSTDAVILAPLNGAPTDFQKWSYNEKGFTLTVSPSGIGTIGLNIPYSKVQNPLITYTTNNNGANGEWYVFPEQSLVTGQWFYIQSDLNQNLQNPTTPPGPDYVLTVSNPTAAAPVQTNQLQPGALTQLWQLTKDGYLVSAINPALALSADFTAGNTVTLQPLGESGWGQYWCVLPNGLLATICGSTVQYLCMDSTVSQASTLTAALINGPVTSYPYVYDSFPITEFPVVSWKLQQYEPDLSGQWFTVQSVDQQGVERMLTLADDWESLEVMPPLGGNILPGGSASINQLWRMTMDGLINSALNPGLYLSANSDGSIALKSSLAGSTDNADQVWTWGQTWPLAGIPKTKYNVQCGQLINAGQQLALYVEISNTNSAVGLQRPSADGFSTPQQGWIIVPHTPAYDQPATIRNSGDQGNYPGLFLCLQEMQILNKQGNPEKSFMVGAGPRGTDPAYSTWSFQHPGFIVSAVNDQIVLSLQVQEGTNPWTPTYGPGVTAVLRSEEMQPFQLWEFTLEGMLINKQSGFALVVTLDNARGQNTFNVTTQSFSAGVPPSLCYWDIPTGLGLQSTLVMPPFPFPSGENFEPIYQEISDKLGLHGGIRKQYQNLAAPLSNYQTAITLMLLKHETAVNWHAVVEQLNEEIIKVSAIQKFFVQAGTFYQEFSQAQALAISEMITACAFPNGDAPVTPPKKKKGWIADIVEGVLYTSLNLAASIAGVKAEATLVTKGLSVGLPFLANVMSAGLTSYQAKQSSKPNSKYQATLQNIYNYELSVFQLQQSLLDMFESVGSALGAMEALILSDWAKINLVYDMIKTTDSADSLYWPASMVPVMTKRMLAGYATKVLQTLIPSNPSFYITAYLHNAHGKGLQPDQQTYYGENPDKSYSEWIASINPDVMNLVWAYGTNPDDFYRQLNGWDILTKYPLTPTTNPDAPGDACLVISIYNMTSVPMLVNNASMQCVINVGVYQIPPYGMRQFAGYDWNASGNYINPNGSFVITESSTNNLVFTGTLAKNTAHNSMPANDLTLTFDAPYYLLKHVQSPQYLQNINFHEIYIGVGHGVTDSIS